MEAAHPQPNDAATALIIEAPDLDTDARRRTMIDAVPPVDPTRQRAALVEAVEHLFPGARLRSFSNGAATFLDPQHLIVASYADLPDSRSQRRKSEPEERQEPLFAA